MAIYMWRELPNYLCFTANTAGSTVLLTTYGSPTANTFETSTDGIMWNTYTLNSTITLSNIGDKVYWRNASETTKRLGTSESNYYNFVMTGSIAASGDINFLKRKDSIYLAAAYDYCYLFYNCTSLTTPPELTGEYVSNYSYAYMFRGCTNLAVLPKLPALTLYNACYTGMFWGCTNIKISQTQTGIYQTEYRIPSEGTGTIASGAANVVSLMFYQTGGTYTADPSINTTYYTSNTVV